MSYGEFNRAILCKPSQSFFNVSNYEFHNINPGIKRKLAIKQFLNLENTLKNLGVDIVYTNELEDHPNSVFVRDTAVIVKGGFIRVKMGLKSRRGEEEKMAYFLSKMGLDEYGRIDPPGTLEGGDVIIGKNVVFIGISSRTNEEGARQMSKILHSLDFEVRIAKFKGSFLHIGGGMSLIGENTVIYCKDSFPKNFFKGFHKIEVSCDNFIGGNVISINGNNIVAEKGNLSAIDKLKRYGFNVIPIDLSEFVRGNGGPGCLVLPLD